MKNETLELAIELREKIDAVKSAIEKFDQYDREKSDDAIFQNPLIAICKSSKYNSGRFYLTPDMNDGECSPRHDIVERDDFNTIKRLIRAALEKRLHNLQNTFEKL